MYKNLQLGSLKLSLLSQFAGVISFSDFCAPAATVEIAVSNGFLSNKGLLLFKVDYPEYCIESVIDDGRVFIRRNGIHQCTDRVEGNGSFRVAIQWDSVSLGVGVAPGRINDEYPVMSVRGAHTPMTVPPIEMIRQLRTENLLRNSAYRSVDELFMTIVDCLNLCESDIRRLGSERFIWGKAGEDFRPKDEPEISRFVASFLASHGAARNFDVMCEVTAGGGSLDFWIVAPVESSGLAKIAIEAKKADNKGLVHGFVKQLPEYMRRLGTNHGIFLTYWLKSVNYPWPKYEGYPQMEMEILHPLARGPRVRTIGMDLSYGPSPSQM